MAQGGVECDAITKTHHWILQGTLEIGWLQAGHLLLIIQQGLDLGCPWEGGGVGELG